MLTCVPARAVACRLPPRNKLAQYRADDAAHNSEACSKYTQTARGLTKGMLGMYCPHGICIAFTILTRHEGPRAAFELIVTHFKRAPAVIVYDNVSHSRCAPGLRVSHAWPDTRRRTPPPLVAGLHAAPVLHEAGARLLRGHQVPH